MSLMSQRDYDEAIKALAFRNENIRHAWKAPHTSPSQNSRRNSARIEKARSYHPSPRTPDRRRPQTSTKYRSSLEDHYRRMMGLEDDDAHSTVLGQQTQQSRPVSWHPGTFMNHEPQHPYTTEPSPTSQYLSYQGSPAYSDAPLVPSEQSIWSSYMYGDLQQLRAPPQISEPTSWYEHGNSDVPSRLPSMWTTESEEEQEARRREREPSIELVGLGLYDEPGFVVKIGSKLEEACDPPEFDDDEEEEEESEEEEDLPKPEETNVVHTNNSKLSLDMSGRSFFVGPHEALESTWWSNDHNKVPHTIVSSVNCGWI